MGNANLNLNDFETWHAMGMQGDTTYVSGPCSEPTLCIHNDNGDVKWVGDVNLEIFGTDGKVETALCTWGELDHAELPPAPRRAGSIAFAPTDVVEAEDYYLHVRVTDAMFEYCTDILARHVVLA